MSQTDAELKANHAADDALVDIAYAAAKAQVAANAFKDHTSIGGEGIFAFLPGTDVSAVGTYTGQVSPTTIINNPSSDRDMRLFLSLIYVSQRQDETGLRAVRTYLSENGGPFGSVYDEARGPFNVDRQVWVTLPFSKSVIIPAGGSYSFATRIDIETQIASDLGDSSILALAGNFHSFIGSTV